MQFLLTRVKLADPAVQKRRVADGCAASRRKQLGGIPPEAPLPVAGAVACALRAQNLTFPLTAEGQVHARAPSLSQLCTHHALCPWDPPPALSSAPSHHRSCLSAEPC